MALFRNSYLSVHPVDRAWIGCILVSISDSSFLPCAKPVESLNQASLWSSLNIQTITWDKMNTLPHFIVWKVLCDRSEVIWLNYLMTINIIIHDNWKSIDTSVNDTFLYISRTTSWRWLSVMWECQGRFHLYPRHWIMTSLPRQHKWSWEKTCNQFMYFMAQAGWLVR